MDKENKCGKYAMNEEPKHPPCRLHAMVAAQADTAVVFRRGPSRWWHVLQWDLKTYELQSGAWVKGILYPRRSAISPDGELLCYFILKGFYPGDEDNKWDAYFAVSKMPWVTALTAWWAGSTWVTGCWFERDNELTISGLPTGLGEPFHGSFPYKVNQIPIWMEWDKARFLQEFKSGWRFIEDEWIRENQEYLRSKLPTDKQAWPQPPMGLIKYRPGDRAMLILLDWGGQSAEHEVQGTHAIEFCMPEYMIRHVSGRFEYLGHLRWADWDHQGNLLTATWTGELCVYQLQEDDSLICLAKQDLNSMKPEPIDSPDWAKSW